MKKYFIFRYKISVYSRHSEGCYIGLNESQKGNIIIALNEANPRPLDLEFKDRQTGNSGTADLVLLYEIEGTDTLELSANMYKFAKEKIETVLEKCQDSFKLLETSESTKNSL